MSRAANAILGGGVFVAVFAAAWFAAPYFENSGPKPPRPAAEESEGARMAAIARGPEAEGEEGGNKTPEEIDAGNQRASVRVIANLQGKKVSEELIAAAERDGPPSDKYIRFATTKNKDGDTVACSVARAENRVEHSVTIYTATDVETNGSAQLAEYIISGCAEAVRDHSQLLTQVQYAQTLARLLPKTPRFDKDRAAFAMMARELASQR